jgi:hypothetical protein
MLSNLLALPAESIPKGTEKHNGAPIIFFLRSGGGGKVQLRL